MYNMLENPLPEEDIHKVLKEAVELEEVQDSALLENLVGMELLK